MIKKRFVKCEWQIALECYDYYSSKYKLIEVLETHETKEEALEHMNKYGHLLNGTSNCLAVKYNEEILSEEDM